MRAGGWLAAVVCGAAALGAMAAAAAAAPAPTARKGPSLLLDAAGIEQLKRRVASAPHAKRTWEALVRRVDAAAGRPVELPERGSNWYHWYVCPEHGNRLTTGRSIGKWRWEHLCPVDRKVFLGDPARVETDYDGCRLASEHSGLASLARDAGLAFQVTGERKYLELARSVLLAYAGRYADYPLHTTRNQARVGGGKVGPQTLDESTWLIPTAQAADLVWDALSADDRRAIAEKLLLPAARDVILPHRMTVHNIQCWKNSAVGLVGLLLDDAKLVESAIDDPRSGYRVQLAKGVGPDGAWWEGAWGYHFYTVSALLPLAEAARNRGIDLYVPELKRMFDLPLELAMPDGVLPDFNDSGAVRLAGSAALYEVAYARFGDERYVPLLAASGRSSAQAMLVGAAPLPEAREAERPGGNYPGTGFAVLRKGKGAQATWLCLDYGPHGGGHGHPDKLSFVLYAGGQVISPDGGITSYGSPMHAGWFRTTLAHSTLMVDEQNQRPAEGKCLAFGTAGEGVEHVVADAGPIAEGVRFVRTAALIDEETVLFVDQVTAAKEQTLDLAFRHRGTWQDLPEGRAFAPPTGKPGWSYLADATSRPAAEGMTLRVRGKDGRATSAITLAGAGEAMEVITATAPGSSRADRVPTMIVRRKGRELAVAWCVALDGKARGLKVAKVRDGAGAELSLSEAMSVEVTGGARPVTVLVNPSSRRVRTAGAGGRTSERAFEAY